MAISDVGNGVTIVFGTSGFSARLQEISGPSASRPSVETTHMSTTLNKTFMPGDLVDQGEYDVTFHFDPSLTPPIASAAETVTITWPIPSGLTTGATWVASCFMTDYSPTAALDQLMTVSGKLKVSGAVTRTAAA